LAGARCSISRCGSSLPYLPQENAHLSLEDSCCTKIASGLMYLPLPLLLYAPSTSKATLPVIFATARLAGNEPAAGRGDNASGCPRGWRTPRAESMISTYPVTYPADNSRQGGERVSGDVVSSTVRANSSVWSRAPALQASPRSALFRQFPVVWRLFTDQRRKPKQGFRDFPVSQQPQQQPQPDGGFPARRRGPAARGRWRCLPNPAAASNSAAGS